MQTIHIKYKHPEIEDFAATLVAAAPARADYFGTVLRAKYATTRPADVVAQYHRTIRHGAWAYDNGIPAAMRARMKCDACGATDCKMWREYQTVANHTKILCGACAMIDQKETGTIGADGKHESEYGRRDQIGWMVPAVPTFHGSFWGYTSVPAAGCLWWCSLPTSRP